MFPHFLICLLLFVGSCDNICGGFWSVRWCTGHIRSYQKSRSWNFHQSTARGTWWVTCSLCFFWQSENEDMLICRSNWQVVHIQCRFEKQDGVVLMSTTRNLKQIDEALQRPGRMDRTFHLQRPTQAEREKILYMAAKETMDNQLIDYVDWKKVFPTFSFSNWTLLH